MKRDLLKEYGNFKQDIKNTCDKNQNQLDLIKNLELNIEENQYKFKLEMDKEFKNHTKKIMDKLKVEEDRMQQIEIKLKVMTDIKL